MCKRKPEFQSTLNIPTVHGAEYSAHKSQLSVHSIGHETLTHLPWPEQREKSEPESQVRPVAGEREGIQCGFKAHANIHSYDWLFSSLEPYI